MLNVAQINRSPMPTALRKVDCVLFDLDGTLIDTVDLIHRSFDYAVKRVLDRKLTKEELLRNMGRPLAVQMRVFSPAKAEELLNAYNDHNLAEHDKNISAYPGAAVTLRRLRVDRRVGLGIVTSKKRDLCLRGLELTKLFDFFEIIVAMEDTIRHKPEPEPVLTALRALGKEPERTVFVGDSPFDIAAGKSAGTITAAALWGPFAVKTLREAGPDFEVRSFSELYALLAREPA